MCEFNMACVYVTLFRLVGSNSVRTSDNFEAPSDRETESNLNELLAHMKINAIPPSSSTPRTSTTPTQQTTQRYYVTSDGLLYENEHETFDRVRNVQLKRAAASDRRNNISLIPNF